MYKDKNILGLIPARGGSKGLPGKNIKPLLGKPLIAWTIEQALASKYLDKVVVSTEDEEIAGISKKYGAEIPFFRPKDLATDKSLVIDAIRYTVEKLENSGFLINIIVILEPTAPTRKINDINKSIDILIKNNVDCVATFSEMDISPNRIWKIHDNKVEPFMKKANPWLPRQKQPRGYRLNGQIYAFKREILFKKDNSSSLLFGKIFPLITPKERVIDIDTNMDFMVAGTIMKYIQDKKRKDRK